MCGEVVTYEHTHAKVSMSIYCAWFSRKICKFRIISYQILRPAHISGWVISHGDSLSKRIYDKINFMKRFISQTFIKLELLHWHTLAIMWYFWCLVKLWMLLHLASGKIFSICSTYNSGQNFVSSTDQPLDEIVKLASRIKIKGK